MLNFHNISSIIQKYIELSKTSFLDSRVSASYSNNNY